MFITLLTFTILIHSNITNSLFTLPFATWVHADIANAAMLAAQFKALCLLDTAELVCKLLSVDR